MTDISFQSESVSDKDVLRRPKPSSSILQCRCIFHQSNEEPDDNITHRTGSEANQVSKIRVTRALRNAQKKGNGFLGLNETVIILHIIFRHFKSTARLKSHEKKYFETSASMKCLKDSVPKMCLWRKSFRTFFSGISLEATHFSSCFLSAYFLCGANSLQRAALSCSK